MSNYSKKFQKTKYLGDKARRLQGLSNNKIVVHLGCTDWPNQIEQIQKKNLLHLKLMESSKRVIGIDIDKEGISHLQNLFKYQDFFVGDISSSSEIQKKIIDIQPDYLFIPDVLEHIENSRDFLIGVERVLSETNATAIFTTPNAFALKTFIPIFFGLDFTHPDHCLLHNEFTISHAMNDANLKIIKVGYLSRDISERYGTLLQFISRPFDWFCKLFPRFADTLYVEVASY